MSIVSVYGREFVPVHTAEEAIRLDAEARSAGGVPQPVLMENAGRSAALIVQRLFPDGRVIAAVGSGNNGGDALVLLRTLRAWGRKVAWFAAGPQAPAHELLHGFDIPQLQGDDVATSLARAGVLIDGILGTGAHGPPRAEAAAAISVLNDAGVPVVALDLPSGVDATTGSAADVCVNAALTIAFGAPKLGLILQPARARCGRLIAIEIGFPPIDNAAASLITPAWAARALPRRPPDAHKGTSGKLLLIAGRTGMAGAGVIAGRSAIRSGVGLVHIVSPDGNRAVLQRAVPEAIFIDRAERAAVLNAARAANAIAIGPGIGTDDDAEDLLRALLETGSAPVVLDADALTLVSRNLALLDATARTRPVVLTPHLGEMTRLTKLESARIAADRVQAARTFAEAHACTLLLKGAPSLVAASTGHVRISTTGSSDLATAGMGDQLTGAIGAFLAGGVAADVAAALALFFGGRAADLARKGISLSPLDVIVRLPRALARPGRMRGPFGLQFITFDQPPRH